MKHFIIVTLSLLLFSCKRNDFTYFTKDELKFEEINLENNTRIRLLSYSGGDNCGDGKTYYQQFIGIRTETNDTIRIFSKCFINFHPDINQNDTIVYFVNDASEILKKYKTLDVNKLTIDEELTDELDGLIEISNNKSKEYLIYNDKQKSIECGNYKTSFGFIILKP